MRSSGQFFARKFLKHKKHKMHKQTKIKGHHSNFKPLYFFCEKILEAQKAQNAYKQTKTKKAAFLCA